MNATIATLTWRSLLGRRRAFLLLILPVVMLIIAVVSRIFDGSDAGDAVDLLDKFSLGFVIPLVCLIAGTGAIGPEIDDGSIVYLLAKPLNRYTIVQSKLVVAVAVAVIFGALPTLIVGLVLTGGTSNVAVAYGVAALVAGIAYSALFLLLGVISRSAVVIGLLYALIWEAVIGGYVPGAQALSIQQWSKAIAKSLIGGAADSLDVTSAVNLTVGIILLIVVTVGSTAYAGYALRSLRLSSDE